MNNLKKQPTDNSQDFDTVRKKGLSIQPTQVFQGFDTITNEGLSTPITGDVLSTSEKSEMEYKITKSIDELYTALNISASVSASYGFISADAKVKVVNELNLTKESICIVVKAVDRQNGEVTNDYKLKDNIKNPTTEAELIEFIKKYGDSFISKTIKGSEYYAIYAFTCESKNQRLEVETQLKVEGIGGSGSLSTDLQSKFEKVTRNSTSSVSFKQIVGGLKQPKLPDQYGILAYALKFLDLEIDNPVIISYETTSYSRVPGFINNLFDQIKKNVKYFTDSAGEYSKQYIQVNNLMNQCEQLEKILNFYNIPANVKLHSVKEEAFKDINVLNEQRHEYSSNPLKNFTLPQLPSLTHGIPKLVKNFSSTDLYGGDGGDVFEIDHKSYLEQLTKISSVTLRYGTFIDALIVTYESSNPSKSIFTEQYGKNGGGKSHTLHLDDGIRIESVSGRYGRYVDSLKFQASNGNSIEGGGSGGSKSFLLLKPENKILVGFKGRSGKYLDKIGLVYAEISDIKWD